MGYRSREEQEEDAKDEKRLQKMSVEELKVELDARMKESLIEEIENLPRKIDSHLNEAAWKIICTALGVKKDHWHDGKWEIDSHHEQSALARALGEHTLTQIKLAIPGFIEGLVVGDPKVKGIKAAYERSYKERLAHLLNDKIWEVAHKKAEQRFVEIMEKVSSGSVDSADDEDAEEDAG